MKISLIGLGRTGLCTAACLAAKGHDVIGVDSNPALLAGLHKRRCPVNDSGLAELLQATWDKLRFTADHAEAVEQSDITMLAVPTPSQADGRFGNEHILTALEQISPAIKAKTRFHIITVASTVMPGSCGKVFRPLLEKLTGKQCGVGFGLVYNPEVSAPGPLLTNFLQPDMVLIGASDPLSAETLREAYVSALESTPYYSCTTLINAEIAKLGLSCFMSLKVSFVNELTALCEGLPGANIDAVSMALAAEPGIGPKCMTGGLGFGGPSFSRDNKALQALGKETGYATRLSPAAVAVNKAIPSRLLGILRKKILAGRPVALFGVAYKQHTDNIKNSQGVLLARLLIEAGYPVRIHDPLAQNEAARELGTAAEFYDSPYDAARGAGGIVLLTNWPQFSSYDWNRLEEIADDDAVLLDSWRILQGKRFLRMHHIALGAGARDEHHNLGKEYAA